MLYLVQLTSLSSYVRSITTSGAHREWKIISAQSHQERWWNKNYPSMARPKADHCFKKLFARPVRSASAVLNRVRLAEDLFLPVRYCAEYSRAVKHFDREFHNSSQVKVLLWLRCNNGAIKYLQSSIAHLISFFRKNLMFWIAFRLRLYFCLAFKAERRNILTIS